MSIFAIGDLHLSMDPRIKKPMDIFGDRWANHSQRLEKAWRETVGAEDTVIVAGDISWGLKLDEAEADLQWLNDLPGHKVMIKGNHDLWWTGITKLNRMYPNITFLQNECYEADGYFICGSRGWICPGADDFTLADDKIFKREVMRIERSLAAAQKQNATKIIGVTHFPPTNDKLQPSAFTDLFSKAGVETVVYGHLHGPEAYKKGISSLLNGVHYQLVSLDYLNCVPLKIV